MSIIVKQVDIDVPKQGTIRVEKSGMSVICSPYYQNQINITNVMISKAVRKLASEFNKLGALLPSQRMPLHEKCMYIYG